MWNIDDSYTHPYSGVIDYPDGSQYTPQPNDTRQPAVCPVCDGRGERKMPRHCDSRGDNMRAQCRACNGKGIVWAR